MEDRFDFDPQLPALPLAFDLTAIARLFEEQWPVPPGAAPGPVTVQGCRLQDTKYQPLVRCVTTYELQVARPGTPPAPTIGVVEITPDGLTHRLFDDDPQLPWLALATDPDQMRERFAALPAGQAGGGAVTACAITPVRYKPGARCVFRYDLQTAAGPQIFFGKLLARDADQLAATLTALHAVSQATPGMARILPPLAYWPDLRMLIQPAVVGGAELNTLAFAAAEDRTRREQWLRAAGQGLAALHGSAGTTGARRTLADDLEELDEYEAPLAQVAPPLAARFQAVRAAIAVAAGDRAEAAPVAGHGTFRTDQFLIEANGLVMIDLDSFCWASPARDIGNFLAYLRWKAIRRPAQADFIDHAGRTFLAGYAAARPLPDAAWLALYEAAPLLKIAGRRFRSLTRKEWPLVPDLIAAASATLDSGALR